MPEKRYRTLNALMVANTGLSACWLFFEVCSGRPFLFPRHVRRTSHQITPHKRHLRVLLTGCFLRAAGGPFFIYRR
ncbi:hypothetical protein O5907_24685, partial [Escherichia coli]|nr:hypothetical protein [Escherichia coli]